LIGKEGIKAKRGGNAIWKSIVVLKERCLHRELKGLDSSFPFPFDRAKRKERSFVVAQDDNIAKPMGYANIPFLSKRAIR
jgi:hypothetical protein